MGEIILQAKNIDKSFSNGKTKLSVLKDFSLDVDVGQIITIMGQSGSGKTTALNILGTLDQADAGELSINGKQVHDMNETELSTIRNRDIGFVFQFHHLLPEFSAIENILMPTWINGADDRRDRALDLIEKMGLSERKDHFPSQLSGGERSRVAVARALMNKPKLVLADEPTGNLDEKNANKLIDLLGKINKDFHQAIVLTTHNPKIARIGHKQFFLENGSLSEKA
ncbi:MAG: ABC transporter ATP-binding protein [Candidatus Marinimicrobia bacterium]|jgi:lipoprotein-releasing system ATP-binding protein|nr:ABC transporter ATP-binding protein [Candidatus Neomarinimicrobiota bacterium]MBT3847847.1 ABC transporter ATP-binding protein [Candidatus Neomarinimicrobiota bacterium]MBT4369601.1 ABC transporter ATP-binding protein [Candidatus Neomarinimicrobiota bacterium]MBT4662162.1 ABC transporter ATP-binding protein [Candidatus Neomarinimicrobiota bacterium]MBT4828708.1 ABC transporter ATP-binding protein [Candidatus Neomarinimicrobiota bacterium]